MRPSVSVVIVNNGAALWPPNSFDGSLQGKKGSHHPTVTATRGTRKQESELQQFREFFASEPGIPDNTTHGICVHRIVARDSEDSGAIRHDYVLALAYDTKPGSLQSSDSRQVVYSRDSSHKSKLRPRSRGHLHQGINRLLPPGTRVSHP